MDDERCSKCGEVTHNRIVDKDGKITCMDCYLKEYHKNKKNEETIMYKKDFRDWE